MSENRIRKNKDGSLWAPKRGKPPKCPEGYVVDPGDPYRFLKSVIERCKYLEQTFVPSSCCGMQAVFKCSMKRRKITGKDCEGCKIKKY